MIMIVCISTDDIVKTVDASPFIIPIVYRAKGLVLEQEYEAEDSMRVNTYGEPLYYIPALRNEYLAERFLTPLEAKRLEKLLFIEN